LLDSEVLLERDLFHPLISGTDVKRYASLPNRQYILFPYRVSESSIIDFEELNKKYPLIAGYLKSNKIRLEGREKGKMKRNDWYGYIYLKNLKIFVEVPFI
jgi:hypothetical protein